MSHRILMVVVLAGWTLSLFGCTSKTSQDDLVAAAKAATSDGPVETAPGDAAAERPKLTAGEVEPAENDTLMMHYQQGPDTINPVTSSDTVANLFQRHVYEGLCSGDFNHPDDLLPGLATHWEFDKEKLEYTIHLRKGVKWHPMRLPNGTMLPEREFTSKDVKFSFDCVLNPYVEAAHIRSYYEDPEAKDPSERYKIKVTVIDDYTVKIRWTKPYFLAEEFTLGRTMLPRHVFSVDENGEPISFDFSSKEFADGFNNHWANTKMCGTGPMIFKEWAQNRRLVLERNPDYWGKPYYFNRIIIRCIPNLNTAMQQVLQNKLDFFPISQKDKYFQSQDHPNVKAGKVKLVEYKYPGYIYIGYNLRRDLFKDKRFRLALAHATPVQMIIDEVLKGLGVPVAGPFLPGSKTCDDSSKPIPYDLDAARALLDEAGWKDTDDDGVRDKLIDNVRVQARFDLTVIAENPSYRTIGAIYKENCRKIGVEVQVSPANWQLMLQKQRKWDFDASMCGWGTSWKRSDPFQLWHGSQADIKDSSNHIGYRNDEVDKLIEQLRVTMDEDEQYPLFHKIHRMIFEDQPYTFLFSGKATAGLDGRLQNVKFYKIRPCRDTTEWYSDQPRLMGQ
jgi:ABC-type transport system substrate-binding protein